MFQIVPLLLASLLFTACSSQKESLDVPKDFQENTQRYIYLKHSEVTWLKPNQEEPVVATYLQAKSQKEKREIFIVSVSKADALSFPYKIMLNTKSALKIISYQPDEALLKRMPFVEEWQSYFRVEFASTKAKKLEVDVVDANGSHHLMEFAKVAKYTFDEKPTPLSF
jgi:hypothetical protein